MLFFELNQEGALKSIHSIICAQPGVWGCDALLVFWTGVCMWGYGGSCNILDQRLLCLFLFLWLFYCVSKEMVKVVFRF